jgi:hypothetical protein
LFFIDTYILYYMFMWCFIKKIRYMVKWKDKTHHIKQERRIIDGTAWWAHELHNEFLENIRWEFTDKEWEYFITGWHLKIKYFSHITENILNALKLWEQNTISSDIATIEVTINDQLIGLLYERRTAFNHAEITYIIFQEQLHKLKKEILKK